MKLASASVVTLSVLVLPACSGNVPDVVDQTRGSQCVDASGPNSSPEQLYDARFSLPELSTKDKSLRTGAIRQTAINGLFNNVPPGGDAGFAQAACNLRGGWQQYFFGVLTFAPVDPKNIASTPHVLRDIGRRLCTQWAGTTGTEQAIDAELRAVNDRDPGERKQAMLAVMDQQLQSGTLDEEGMRSLQISRDQLAAEPLSVVTENDRAAVEIKRAAMIHQCPGVR